MNAVCLSLIRNLQDVSPHTSQIGASALVARDNSDFPPFPYGLYPCLPVCRKWNTGDDRKGYRHCS